MPVLRLDRDALTLRAPQGIRLVALLQVRQARSAARALRRRPTPSALHRFRVALRRLRTWLRAYRDDLRPAVRGKDRRRLREIAQITGRGRDTDVQIAWLKEAAGRWQPSRRRGAAWLRDYLTIWSRSAASPHVPDALRDFDALAERLEARLATWEAPVSASEHPLPSLATALSLTIVPHAESVASSLAGIETVRDESTIHEARIAAKRLRYLLEQAIPFVPGVRSLVQRARTLQEQLGEVHDAQVMDHQIRAALDAASKARARRVAREGAGLEPRLATIPEGAVRAVAQQVRVECARVLAGVLERWTGRERRRFVRDARAVASSLRKLD